MDRGALWIVVVAVALAGCTPREQGRTSATGDQPPAPGEPSSSYDFRWSDTRAGVLAEISVPADQGLAIGTYDVKLTFPGGRTQRIEGERNGAITQAWLTDLGADQRLELLVATTAEGSGSYGEVAVYTQDGDTLAAVELAELDDTQSDGYGGADVFEVADGHLYRSFPVHVTGDANAQPTGGNRRLRYDFAAGRWVTLPSS
jgi:Periplasmic lysozyme inhibitor of I-type lysozyme